MALSFQSFQSGHLGNCWFIETVPDVCSHETGSCVEKIPFQMCASEHVLRKPESPAVKIVIKPTLIATCLAKNFCLPSSTLSFMEEVTPCEAARLCRETSSSLVPVTTPVLVKTLSLSGPQSLGLSGEGLGH